jgi:type VI secretion system protein ImpC
MSMEASRSAAEAPVEARDPEEFAEILKQSFKPRTERAATEVENAVTTLVREALSDASVIKDDVLDTIEEMIARLDAKLTEQVNAIIHAPEFQRIESAWRGLHYLVFNSETDATLKIRVMNVAKIELYRNRRGLRADGSRRPAHAVAVPVLRHAERPFRVRMCMTCGCPVSSQVAV